ncbi:MAG: MFS transporter [Sphingobium sp.]|nr:MFS transporter [Sphingobium sp.]
MLAFAQRQLPAALGPIFVADLGISDAALGALHGPSFAIAYGLLALFGGWLVDRGSRVRILAASLGIASAATAAGAWATGVEDLAAARLVVGLGQAALVPAAYSLIGDLVPQRRSGRTIAIFACGPFLGSGLMLLGGGATAASLGWAATFLVVGGIGLFVAALLGGVPDPPHQPSAPHGGSAAADHLRSHWQAILIVLATMLCTASAGQILLGWTVSWLMRDHGWGSAAASSLFGLAVLIGGTSGTLAAGAASDLLLKKFGMPRLVVLAGAALCGGLAAMLVFTIPNGLHAGALLFPTLFLLAAAHATGPAALQDITPAALRGRQHGAAVLVINLFGFALGPWLVGLASDFDGRAQALGDMLAVAVPVLLATSGVVAFLGAWVHARTGAAIAQTTAPGRPSSTA